MRIPEIKKIYARYARIYDGIFARWFLPRTAHVVEALDLPSGRRILDVGVGTGLALPLYPTHVPVTGIDLSREMLREARHKVARYHLDHIRLLEMDAGRLAFRDGSFDAVIVAFVISVVPDPIGMMAEIKRVCKPQGRIVLINHFQSDNRLMAQVETWLAPLCRKLGWHSDMRLDDLVQGADLRIERRYTLHKFDLWQIVFVRNHG